MRCEVEELDSGVVLVLGLAAGDFTGIFFYA
jgi:hypothetical protein